MYLSNILLTAATLAGLAIAGPIAERQAQKLRISEIETQIDPLA
jgi:hypothetical protein